MKSIKSSRDNPRLRQAAIAMNRNDIPQAERLLKAHLYEAPTDVPAIRMLAEVAARLGRDEDAMKLLERCLELAPDFMPARYNLAVVLHRRNDATRAFAEMERLLAADPRNPSYRNLAAVILSRVGEYERSSRMYADLLKERPENAKVWLSYGHVLKTEGRQDDSIAAYRRAIERDPAFGEAYWSLANLKTFRFTEADLAAMLEGVENPAVEEANRVHLHFALGKAFDDRREAETSFGHYSQANAIRHSQLDYDPEVMSGHVDKVIATFTPEFIANRAGQGEATPDPIFILGMPRAGSTLPEQTLASHSQRLGRCGQRYVGGATGRARRGISATHGCAAQDRQTLLYRQAA